MAIKFYKLIDLMNRRGISKGDLQELTGISSATMARISANRNISLDVISKVCAALDCQPADIMEFVKE